MFSDLTAPTERDGEGVTQNEPSPCEVLHVDFFQHQASTFFLDTPHWCLPCGLLLNANQRTTSLVSEWDLDAYHSLKLFVNCTDGQISSTSSCTWFTRLFGLNDPFGPKNALIDSLIHWSGLIWVVSGREHLKILNIWKSEKEWKWLVDPAKNRPFLVVPSDASDRWTSGKVVFAEPSATGCSV